MTIHFIPIKNKNVLPQSFGGNDTPVDSLYKSLRFLVIGSLFHGIFKPSEQNVITDYEGGVQL